MPQLSSEVPVETMGLSSGTDPVLPVLRCTQARCPRGSSDRAGVGLGLDLEGASPDVRIAPGRSRSDRAVVPGGVVCHPRLSAGRTDRRPGRGGSHGARWPSPSRPCSGHRSPGAIDPFAVIVWLGLAAGLLLVPSIGSVLNQLLARGPQTLVPSLEAAYPWLLALLATSLFAGLGIARRILGESAVRRTRFVRGAVIGIVLAIFAGALFAGAAIANDLALRDRSSLSSRFGPTAGDGQPPRCGIADPDRDDGQARPASAGDVDGRPAGAVGLVGDRSGVDVRWTADVASDLQLGRFGLTRLGDRAWTRGPRQGWTSDPPAVADAALIDVQVCRPRSPTASGRPRRTAASSSSREPAGVTAGSLSTDRPSSPRSPRSAGSSGTIPFGGGVASSTTGCSRTASSDECPEASTDQPTRSARPVSRARSRSSSCRPIGMTVRPIVRPAG